MRIVRIAVWAVASVGTLGCGIEQLGQGSGSKNGADAGAPGADAAPPITGQGCGIEQVSGAQLCLVTSACPNVVVNGDAFPHCGFRIKAGATELVCGCGDVVCSMGPYTTCAQAASLLASQVETIVCTQVAEGRCTPASPNGAASSSGAASSGGPQCDRQCLQECGAGAGCASVCGC